MFTDYSICKTKYFFYFYLKKQMETSKNEAWNTTQPIKQENKRVMAGIFGIVLGGFALHKFILGYTKEGIIQIILVICTCGIFSIVSIIEGIIYLTKSDEEFYETYQVNKRGWF